MSCKRSIGRSVLAGTTSVINVGYSFRSQKSILDPNAWKMHFIKSLMSVGGDNLFGNRFLTLTVGKNA